MENGLLYWNNVKPDNPRRSAKAKLIKSRLALLAPKVLVIPYSLQERILFALHNTSVSAHTGPEKTYSRLSRRFYWEGMATDAIRYTNACIICKRRKGVANKNAGEAMQFDEPKQPFEMYGVDFVGPFVESESKNRYVLTAIDFHIDATLTIDCSGAFCTVAIPSIIGSLLTTSFSHGDVVSHFADMSLCAAYGFGS